MIKRTLMQVQEMAKGHGLAARYEDTVITGVSTDSRKVGKGSLFIPLKGENFNGHLYAQKALDEGAAAVLWGESEENPPENAPVILVKDTLHALQQLAKSYKEQLRVKAIGITGSNGKTTAKDLTAAVLSTGFRVYKTQGNFNNHIGLPLTLLSMPETTEIAVLEMGMSAFGEIELLSKIAEPDAAIITNIGESHMAELGSREGIADAKMEIVKGMKPGGQFIYFGDEPLLKERTEALRFSTKPVTFGKSAANGYYPTNIEQTDKGVTFSAHPFQDALFIPVLGEHNVWNALAAAAAGQYFGLTEDQIKEGLEGLQMTAMRLELSKSEQGWSVINDAYNASPTSMLAAIKLMEDLTGYKRKIAVLGDMLELGESEAEFHRGVGEKIHSDKIDYVFTFGKLGEEIAAGAKANFAEGMVKSFTDKSALISELKSLVQKDDLLLVKASRGMKLEEVVAALV
ncbi:UDP-N-acetylmuramoyl-tripeptide--D-alanyl-D-alanine ligase [Metabacillus sp. GX 13764]|uniref:UDP-N-acetylmuramoyl-tripeptide--D-alanyl-D- alanine ligase n=1 Tax=Metabacillus kandeliae TaxID=2900151 RepID=UPI001E4581DD|nr:UDP-N-acetylmuramoyl-tripeptide--D-alanyl-D-alanine ligase [Metabacillus kandeliae]MCD7036091.1 UDP-N-acetylmuramoyl-tripeptide--D-alanyl-D-alanine ligase [Metabacillus kandeliae]